MSSPLKDREAFFHLVEEGLQALLYEVEECLAVFQWATHCAPPSSVKSLMETDILR